MLLGVGWNFLFVSGTALLPRTYEERDKFKGQAINDFTVFTFQALPHCRRLGARLDQLAADATYLPSANLLNAGTVTGEGKESKPELSRRDRHSH